MATKPCEICESTDVHTERCPKFHDAMVIEASDLGLAPGAWPATINFDGIPARRRNALRDGEGEMWAVVYLTADDVEIHVLND